MGWARGCMGEQRDAYRVVVGKPEENGQLGRQKHKWDYNIKKDLKKRDGKSWFGYIRPGRLL